MGMKSEKELRKAEYSIQSRGDVEEELTGCKRAAPKHRKQQFKLSYGEDELKKYLSSNITP